jgi:hypothetical protein
MNQSASRTARQDRGIENAAGRRIDIAESNRTDEMRTSFCLPLEARISDSTPPHSPAGRMWF